LQDNFLKILLVHLFDMLIHEAVAEQYTGAARVVKLNVDDSPAVAQRYGVQGIPTLILFQDGLEKERILGAASQEKISRTIDRCIRAALN
jgi:thioredoxin 1